jgi:hypothetical protein
MTIKSFMKAVDDTRFTGALRLAYIAVGDSNGIAGVQSVMQWANCTDAEAEFLLAALQDAGALVYYSGQLIAPDLIEDFEIGGLERQARATQTDRRSPTPSQRHEVFARDGSSCVYCGCEKGPFHLDHVTPYSRGGLTTVENLVVACAVCNISKGSKTVEEWRCIQ